MSLQHQKTADHRQLTPQIRRLFNKAGGILLADLKVLPAVGADLCRKHRVKFAGKVQFGRGVHCCEIVWRGVMIKHTSAAYSWERMHGWGLLPLDNNRVALRSEKSK